MQEYVMKKIKRSLRILGMLISVVAISGIFNIINTDNQMNIAIENVDMVGISNID